MPRRWECGDCRAAAHMGAALQRNLQNMRRGGGSAPPVHEHCIFTKCHSEERSDVGIRIPLTAAYHAEGVRIATPVCAPVRNDRVFDKRYGAFRRRGEGTPPYAWVEGAVRGRRRGVGKIGEAPPAADEASRFRGSAPIGGHDSGRESAGTTVGGNRLARRWAVAAPYGCGATFNRAGQCGERIERRRWRVKQKERATARVAPYAGTVVFPVPPLHFSPFCGILVLSHFKIKEFSPWKP